MKKRLTALITVLTIMLWSVVPVSAAADRVTQNSVFSLMTAIGCINDDLALRPDSTITKGEFVDILLSLIDMRDIADYNEPVFLDVTLNTPYAAQINTAYSLGIITRDSSMRFYPSKTIMMNEALEMVINLLGYSILADKTQNNWYMRYASDLELLDGMTTAMNSELTVSAAAVLAYNALNAPRLEQAGNGHMEQSDTAMMEGVLGIYYRTGTVTAAGNMNAESGGMLREGTIKIDGVEYLLGETGFTSVLGQVVRFWYEINDNGERLLVYIENANEELPSLFIDAESLETQDSGFAANNIVYCDDEGKTKRIRLSTDRAIVNGMSKQIALSDFDFSDYDGGYVKLSQDDKGDYNYVEIVKYNNHIVSAVNRSSMTVWFEDNTSLKLNPDDYSDIVLINISDMYYEDKTIDDISIGDVVSIYESENGEFIGAFLSSTRFMGTIMSVIPSESEVDIDGKTYKATCELNCSPGETYTFSMDFRNRIAKIDSSGADTGYVYLINAYENEAHETFFKIFDPADGTVKDYMAAGKITLGGIKFSRDDYSGISGQLQATSDNGDSQCPLSQLVKIRVNNEQKITVIETAEQSPSDNAFSLDYSKSNLYSASFGFIEGRFSTTDSSTLIIRVPKDRMDYDEYTAEAGMPNSCNINAYLYDIDTATNIPSVIVADMGTVVYTDDSLDYGPYALVADVNEEYVEADNDVKIAVTYFVMNEEVKVYYDLDEYLPDKSNNGTIAAASLVRGDILQVRQEQDDIAAARMIYRSPAREDGGVFTQGTHIGSVNNKFISYGNIRSIYGQYVIVQNPDSGIELTLNIGGARIYRYNVKDDRAEIVSSAELEYGQKIIFRSVDAQMGDIVIIEED